MDEKSGKLANLTSITSAGNRLDANDHELDIQAVTSQPLSLNEVGQGVLTTEQKYSILTRLDYEHLENFEDLPPGAIFMLEKIGSMSLEEALDILRGYLEEHLGDVNIPSDEYDFIERLVSHGEELAPPAANIDGAMEKSEAIEASHEVNSFSGSSEDRYSIHDWELQAKTEAGIIAYWSPYPEIRSVTDPYDDPNMPIETLRVYIVGLVWTCIGCFINTYFQDRQPAITLDPSVAQLFMYPSGVFMSYVLPKWKFKIWKYTIDLNPGKWNYKEQMLATICFTISQGSAYVVSNIQVQKMDVFYNNDWVDFGYQLLLMLTTNFMGFGLAGVVRKFTVYPEFALWPTNLPTMALNKALTQPEKKTNINGWTISRYSFYFLTFAASFIWFWVPDYLFTALSTFNWLAWIKPDSLNLATITGFQTGLGVNPISTFDWNIVNLSTPLTIPFFANANLYAGMIMALFCICGIWYTNSKWTGFLPINSNQLFTNTGELYAVTKVVTSNSLFDEEAYKQYGPPFYTAANLVVYGAFFAIYPFLFFYVHIMYWKQIKSAFIGLWKIVRNFRTSSTYDGFNDSFSRSMTRYKETPEWAYLVILVISLVLGIICVEIYPAQTPVWAIFFALAINFIFLIPFTIINATTGYSIGLNVLVELIVGYAIPNNGLALMFIKALGYNIDGQARLFLGDLKIGHYLRIPPRAVFRIQIVSTLVFSFVSLGVVNLTMNTIENYCHPRQPQKFTCPNSTTFYASSVLWGVIGPKKVFNGLYPVLRWCFLIGFLLVFPAVLVQKKWKNNKFVKSFSPVLVIGGFLNYAPYNLSYYTPGLIAAYFFMLFIRTRYFSWWSKYNYVLSSGLTAGVAFSSIIIFFSVQYNPKYISWWGNNVNDNGLDAEGPTRLNVTTQAPDGYFGPRFGNFP